MRPEAIRLGRLRRLERIRAIAKHHAAQEAARAEGTLAQLEALANRTEAMADAYRARTGASDGMALRQIGSFVAGLDAITHSTLGDAQTARGHADRKQQDLARAERQRAAVEDRAEAEASALAKARTAQPLGPRRNLGTDLD